MTNKFEKNLEKVRRKKDEIVSKEWLQLPFIKVLNKICLNYYNWNDRQRNQYLSTNNKEHKKLWIKVIKSAISEISLACDNCKGFCHENR